MVSLTAVFLTEAVRAWTRISQVFKRVLQPSGWIIGTALSALLAGCGQDVSDLNRVAYVDMGLLGPNALLTEVCLEEVPYYLLISTARTGKPGNKGALATRYSANGQIPDCSTNEADENSSLVVKKVTTVRPERNVGILCVEGVSYLFIDSMYTAGLAPRRSPNGNLIGCDG